MLSKAGCDLTRAGSGGRTPASVAAAAGRGACADLVLSITGQEDPRHHHLKFRHNRAAQDGGADAQAEPSPSHGFSVVIED